MNNKNNLSDKIRAFREQHNLTQDEFGSAVGVSRQTVNKWESGRSEFPSNLIRISNHTNPLYANLARDILGEVYGVPLSTEKAKPTTMEDE